MSRLLKTFKTTLEYDIGLMGQLLFLNTSGAFIPLFSHTIQLYIERYQLKFLNSGDSQLLLCLFPL